jgi:hypothetical protein
MYGHVAANAALSVVLPQKLRRSLIGMSNELTMLKTASASQVTAFCQRRLRNKLGAFLGGAKFLYASTNN